MFERGCLRLIQYVFNCFVVSLIGFVSASVRVFVTSLHTYRGLPRCRICGECACKCGVYSKVMRHCLNENHPFWCDAVRVWCV